MNRPTTERLLTIPEVAELLGTTERFPRRLVAERRVTYIKVGRHVRIPESALADFIEANTIQPVRRRRARYGRVAA
ncbi:helix-turn-helix domain-containing protein [Streptomyces sp. NPDC053560]|uniref:helix-turn-helix domain-containing protein n=1 Tax=Streptomyces sp. NPDC053560 TaxID=3365711 RepID=UPI0037D63930